MLGCTVNLLFALRLAEHKNACTGAKMLLGLACDRVGEILILDLLRRLAGSDFQRYETTSSFQIQDPCFGRCYDGIVFECARYLVIHVFMGLSSSGYNFFSIYLFDDKRQQSTFLTVLHLLKMEAICSGTSSLKT